MADLAPAALAVRDAAEKRTDLDFRYAPMIAAALRAAADQVVPEEYPPNVPDFPDSDEIAPYYEWLYRRRVRAELLAIAAELESADHPS